MDSDFRAAHPTYTPLEVIGLTTVFGNCHVDLSTSNALRLLELMGRVDIPVAAGEPKPVDPAYPAPFFAAFVHGEDGFGNTNQPAPSGEAVAQTAAEFLVEQTALAPGEVTVLAVGPLSNLARALELDPNFASNVAEVIVMGGAYTVSGNVTPAAEANFWNDAVAADKLCSSGCKLKLLGLDVTQQAFLSGPIMRDRIGSAGTGGAWMAAVSKFYYEFNLKTTGADGCYLHDPMTVLAAMDESICEWRSTPVRVISEGFARGHSLMVKKCYVGPNLEEPGFHDEHPSSDFGHRPAEVALGVDWERAVANAVELLSFDFPVVP